METERTEDALEDLRTAYLRLRGALHDRATDLPAYPVLFDTLRRALDAKRQLGVIHVDLANLDLVESLYGWQVFDRAIAHLAEALKALPGTELPGSTLLAVGGVPADRFVLFVPDTSGGRELADGELSSLCAAVKVRLDRALQDGLFEGVAPRLLARVGSAFLSENPFFRFERRVHAAVEEARSLPDRREARREEAWREELDRMIRESRVRTVWQPVVELDSGSVFGFEALSRGPAESFFESPRAMFALSDRAGTSSDLDRLCRDNALREGAAVAGSRKLFVNVLSATLADEKGWSGAMRERLIASGHRPHDVVVEVSERSLGDGGDSVSTACEALRAQGFSIGLDDVGTGRDGAMALDRLRPDFVKVDPSVVRGIDASLIRQEIFRTIARQSTAIEAEVIGVGVESAEEAATLKALGARYGQGYHFAGPAPRERWTP